MQPLDPKSSALSIELRAHLGLVVKISEKVPALSNHKAAVTVSQYEDAALVMSIKGLSEALVTCIYASHWQRAAALVELYESLGRFHQAAINRGVRFEAQAQGVEKDVEGPYEQRWLEVSLQSVRRDSPGNVAVRASHTNYSDRANAGIRDWEEATLMDAA